MKNSLEHLYPTRFYLLSTVKVNVTE